MPALGDARLETPFGFTPQAFFTHQPGHALIVLAYMRSDVLYARFQRERYETEHTLAIGLGPDARLVAVAMNKGLRLQFQLAGVDE
jgi:hypothetical protein